MAEIYRRPKGVGVRVKGGGDPLYAVVARHAEVQAELEAVGQSAAAIAQRILDASEVRTGASQIMLTRGQTDRHINLIDAHGQPAAVAMSTLTLHKTMVAMGAPEFGAMLRKPKNKRKR